MKNSSIELLNPPFCQHYVTGSTELTHGSLFSGIGGFEVGAERAGIKTIWNCEFEDFQSNVLKKIDKDAEQYRDIRTANITRFYLVGMSVPPVMTAQIAKQVYEQWLSKI